MGRNTFIDLLAIENASEFACGGETDFWMKTFDMPKNRSFGLELKIESPGTVALDVFLEQGNEELVDAAQNLTNANYVVPDGDSAVLQPDTAKVYIIDLGPVVTKFSRLKITGTAGNDAGTKITRARLCVSENA